ncbi:MAG: GTP-binding protein [Erysipelotrichaceae bacterium]|nr:GTP-binding protein [Erysipelotrichaceae bacterium]
MVKPVYVFSGFLDSGKTRAIKESLCNPNFNDGESTLIIAFEQGDEEYDEKFLKACNCEVLYLDSINELTIAKQKQIDHQYPVERIFIEFNGMEDDNILYETGFISNWELAQTLTTIDASSFNLYMTNMRQFMFNHIVNAEVVILNRADNVDRRYLRNNIKSINQMVEIIYEDKDGNVTNKIDDDMFDVSKDLVIDDIDYGLWYMDAVDNPTKYDNKVITIKVKYVEEVTEYDNVLIMGRKAMVCCANDIQDIALTIVNIRKKDIDINKYYLIKGNVHCLQATDGNKTCVLYAKEYKEAETPKEELVTFN